MRKLLAIALVGAGLMVAVPLVAQDQMSAEEQKDWFVGFVEGQLSTPDRQIRISNIDGVLSERASIREITISDAEGVWLRVSNAAIDWDQGALFTGRLLVRSLTADSIDYLRNAIPSGDANLPAPEATPLEVPEFPVAIQLDKLSIPKMTFGPSVFGLGSEVALDGSLKLEGGSLDTALDIKRLDGPGGALKADIAYRKDSDSVDIALHLTEPPDGIIANLLNIEGKPEIALDVAGSGPVRDLTTTLTLDAGGSRALNGQATLTGTTDGLAVAAELGGPIARLVASPYRAFFGDDAQLTADALIRGDGGVDISRFHLGGGQLTLDGSAATTADGFLSRLAIEGAVADPTGGRVTLPVAGADTTIGGARIDIAYGTTSDDNWSADVMVQDFSNGDLSAAGITLNANGVAADLADAEKRRVTFNADGTVAGISTKDPDVAAALGDTLGFGLAGLWNAGAPVQLAQMRLVGKALTAALSGTIDDNVFSGNIALETSSLAPFSGMADRALRGALSLKATGTVSPLIGGFNLNLDGSAENLSLGDAALDRVLAGTVALSGRVARTADGLEAEDFRLGNREVQLAANGTYATGAADFSFNASLSDLGLLTEQASGPLTLTGRATGEGALALRLDANVGKGELAGKPLDGAAIGFAGTLAESGDLMGAVTGTAALAGTDVTLAGNISTAGDTRRIDGLRLVAGPTILTGDIVQNAEGLFAGDVALASTDISTAAALLLVDATGSANATIELSADGGTQNAQVTASANAIRASGASIDSARLNATLADLFGTPRGNFTASGSGIAADAIRDFGIAPFEVTASGSLAGKAVALAQLTANGAGGLQIAASGTVPFDGNGLDLRVNGTAPLALANRFVADRGGQLSGNATLQATVTGSFTDPRLNGSVSTAGSGYIDPELNLRLVDITGSASLAGDRVNIDRLSAGLATGGTVSASGSVGLSSGNPADIAVALNGARYADGNMFVATVSGRLNLAGPLQRSPTLSGTVEIEQADITIPESFGNSAALVDTAHRHMPAAVATTLKRATVDNATGAPIPQTRPSILQMDVTVNAPNQIFVRGRGLDAEVGGSVRLTGPVSDIQPIGGFRLNRGRLAILGQRITFEEGTVTLVGDLNPYIDFTARTDGEDVTVYVTLSGRVSDPQVSFTSTPALPQDEVLSRLLFGRSMSELTPLQLAKLAGAAAELAGGSNSSLVDSLRAKAGLADLDIVTRDDGSLAVQAGAYLQDNVYLGVEAGADGNSRVTVNLDITDAIKAKASTGTDGNDSIGIFYEFDY